MFALFALGGDLGCAAGPALVGLVAEGGALAPLFGGALKSGLFVAMGFPLVLLVCVGVPFRKAKHIKRLNRGKSF
jgi:hypothetical protein